MSQDQEPPVVRRDAPDVRRVRPVDFAAASDTGHDSPVTLFGIRDGEPGEPPVSHDEAMSVVADEERLQDGFDGPTVAINEATYLKLVDDDLDWVAVSNERELNEGTVARFVCEEVGGAVYLEVVATGVMLAADLTDEQAEKVGYEDAAAFLDAFVGEDGNAEEAIVTLINVVTDA